MKLLLLTTFSVLFSFKVLYGQCSFQLNDSLYTNYDYVLNAVNVTGQAPFQFNWTVTDGNGMSIPYATNVAGDSLTISASTIQSSYGCIIYQLCMTDALNCTTCLPADTSALQVPFSCFSAFSSSIVGTNQVSISAFNNIPPFLIMQQFLTWTDGLGAGQGMPYMGPGTILTYTPGPSNPSNQFYLCMISNLTTGGCISCDSIPYMLADINEITENDWKLFPNPTDELLNISSEFAMQNLTLSSMNGVLVLETTLNGKTSHQLNLREIPSGMYIAEITTVNGSRAKKLLVKK